MSVALTCRKFVPTRERCHAVRNHRVTRTERITPRCCIKQLPVLDLRPFHSLRLRTKQAALATRYPGAIPQCLNRFSQRGARTTFEWGPANKKGQKA